jgi:hypothetical protein
MDNANGSRDGKDGEKEGGGSWVPREAKRGQEISDLEAMRIQGDMEKMLLGNHLGQQPPSASRGTYGLLIMQN